MKLLLDTHAFLWWVEDNPALSRRARRAIADPRNDVLFSAVSAWEVTMKVRAGKLRLPEAPATYIPSAVQRNGFATLALGLEHSLEVGALPGIHWDPFDRLLIAQARAESARLVSNDDTVRKYPVDIYW